MPKLNEVYLFPETLNARIKKRISRRFRSNRAQSWFSRRRADYTNCNAANSLIINIQESISILGVSPRSCFRSINYRFPLRLRNDLLMTRARVSRANFRHERRDSGAPRPQNLWHKFPINAPRACLVVPTIGRYVHEKLPLFEFMRIIHRETSWTRRQSWPRNCLIQLYVIHCYAATRHNNKVASGRH